MSSQPVVYTLDEVASILKVSSRKVRQLVERGELPAAVLGGRCRRVTGEQLAAFLDGRTQPLHVARSEQVVDFSVFRRKPRRTG